MKFCMFILKGEIERTSCGGFVESVRGYSSLSRFLKALKSADYSRKNTGFEVTRQRESPSDAAEVSLRRQRKLERSKPSTRPLQMPLRFLRARPKRGQLGSSEDVNHKRGSSG